jgi:chromosome segregation ATPase
MRTNWTSGWFFPAFLSAAALVASGCAESTSEKDVANARKDLREEQQQTAETMREAQKDVADARRDAAPYTVNKPVTPEDAAEARQDIADAQHKANEQVRDQIQNQNEAAVELKTTEQQLAATKARDAFVANSEKKLAEAEARIDQLKATASAAEGPAKETLDREIDTLQNQHDRVKDALGNLKTAKLAEWTTHREYVRVAMQDLDTSMKKVR